MPQVIYDLKGYPQFVYTAHDFAERKARKQPDIKQLANLLIRSIFEDGGLGRVLSIDEVTPGTPVNGWTIRFTGETNGRTADPYIAIYDGQVISYNDDPSRQPRDLSEGLALALEFAAKKGQKNCNKGKPCGGGCIAKGRNCLKDKKDLSKNQQQATDAIAKAEPVKQVKPKAESKPKAEPKPKAEAKPKAEPKPKAEAKPKAESEPKAEAKPKAASKPYLFEDIYEQSNALLRKVEDKQAALNAIIASNSDSFTIGKKKYTKQQAIELANKQIADAKSKALKQSLKTLEELDARRRQDPDGFGIAPRGLKPDAGHDWIPPRLEAVNPAVEFDPGRKIVKMPLPGTFRKTEIQLPPQQFEELYKKHQPMIDALNSASQKIQSRNQQSQQVDNLAKAQNITREESQRRYDAIQAFTNNDYPLIRAADAGKDAYQDSEGNKYPVTKEDRDRAQAINDYIKDAPKYEGAVYRGFQQNTSGGQQYVKEIMSQLKSADGLTLEAMSSFSSSVETAGVFTRTYDKQKTAFVMEVKQNKQGASARSISALSGENEVLVPKGTRYRYAGERQVIIDGVTTIIYEVEEF